MVTSVDVKDAGGVTRTVATIDALMADGGQTTIGAKADAADTHTDTTAITAMSVWKQISKSIQLLIYGAGTAAAALRVTFASDAPGVPALGAVADAAVLGDTNGSIVAFLRGLSKGRTIKSVVVNITADTDIIAAVTSKRIKVIAYSLTSVGTNATLILFKSNGTSGTEVARTVLQGGTNQPYGANLAIAPPGFLFATAAGEKLTIDVNQTDQIHGFITYFDDDAT